MASRRSYDRSCQNHWSAVQSSEAMVPGQEIERQTCRQSSRGSGEINSRQGQCSLLSSLSCPDLLFTASQIIPRLHSQGELFFLSYLSTLRELATTVHGTIKLSTQSLPKFTHNRPVQSTEQDTKKTRLSELVRDILFHSTHSRFSRLFLSLSLLPQEKLLAPLLDSARGLGDASSIPRLHELMKAAKHTDVRHRILEVIERTTQLLVLNKCVHSSHDGVSSSYPNSLTV